ncbi:MAG: rRNA maturation RNase YbeY [Alphaproteobacteria bacterium]|nr:MAG: rRNA maturation RNase YbeY [Alphaproteobacteria bacterium]
MTPDNIDLDIAVEAPVWQDHFPDYEARIEACLGLIIAHVPEAQTFEKLPHLEVSILLCDDSHIQQLNRDYREKDKATNVLSFPSLSDEEIELYLTGAGQVPDFPLVLGDIIFAYGTIKGEALDQGKSFADHFSHLCLHGMLHLLGYDHIEEGPASEMEALETLLLSKLSIDDPY